MATRGAQEEIPYYDSGMKDGTLCKIDVEKIDRAFALLEGSDSGYYVCMSADGRMFVVKMSEKVFQSDFAAVYAYTIGESATSAVATFTGKLDTMTEELTEIGVSYWGGEDFSDYVGTLYIDGSDSAPENYTALWIIAAALFFSVGVINFVVFLKLHIASARCLKCISNAGKTQSVLDEIDSAESFVLGKREMIFGSQYLICSKKGMVYTFNDIFWIYGKRTRVYFFAVSKNLVVCDRFGMQTNMLFSKASSKLVDQAMQLIVLRTPGCLNGFTEQNKKAYAEMTGRAAQ